MRPGLHCVAAPGLARSADLSEPNSEAGKKLTVARMWAICALSGGDGMERTVGDVGAVNVGS
jgi:hypothetical protein